MTKYTVIALDTDYGCVATWSFNNKSTAQQWCDVLNFNFGAGCAWIEEVTA